MLKFILIIWLTGNSQGIPSSRGDILDIYFPNKGVCEKALQKVKKASKGGIYGVCVNWK